MKLEYIHTINEDVLTEGKLRAYLLGLAALASIASAPFIIRWILDKPEAQTRADIKRGQEIAKRENISLETVPIPPELATVAQKLPVPIPNPIQTTQERIVQPAQAQPVQEKKDTEETIFLARILFAEAANQKREAKEAVAQIITNRVARSKNKKNIIDVIKQPYQFTGYNGKLWNKCADPSSMDAVSQRSYNECLDVARKAVNKELPDRIGKATLYHDDSIGTPPTWNKDKIEFIGKIGNFLFYNEL